MSFQQSDRRPVPASKRDDVLFAHRAEDSTPLHPEMKNGAPGRRVRHLNLGGADGLEPERGAVGSMTRMCLTSKDQRCSLLPCPSKQIPRCHTRQSTHGRSRQSLPRIVRARATMFAERDRPRDPRGRLECVSADALSARCRTICRPLHGTGPRQWIRLLPRLLPHRHGRKSHISGARRDTMNALRLR